MRSLIQLISSAAFAGLLILHQSPAQAKDECGMPTPGSPPAVVCDASDDDAEGTVFKNDQSGDVKKWRKDVILYEVHKPKKNRNRSGLKITLSDDIRVLGATVGYRSSFGLGVYATRNAEDGILVESHAEISAALSAILVDTDIGGGDVVPITINVLKGELSTSSSGNNGVIQVNDTGNHGKITVNFSAEIKNVRRDNTGIKVYKYDAPGGDVDVTLKAGSRIGGKIHHGVHIESDEAGVVSGIVASSDFRVTIEKGAVVGTAAEPVKMSGVYALVSKNGLSDKKDKVSAEKHVTVTHHGHLYAAGDGIKIEHKHGDSKTYAGGTASVTIGEDGVVTVTGDTNFGISLNTPDTAGGMREQSVAVYGKVFGGKSGGAIHLVGGGTLTIGRNAMLMPDDASDSYKTVQVKESDPASGTSLVIKLDRNFRGMKNIENAGETSFKYNLASDDPGDSDYMDLTDGTKIEGVELTSLPCGIYSNCSGKETLTAEITDKDANNVFSLNFRSEITERTAPAAGQGTASMRGRVYEALPSVMWDMVGALGTTYMPSMMSGGTASASGPLQLAQNGTMAAADPGMMSDRRAWGSIEVGDGERRLQKSVSGNLSYDFSYSGFATGVDLPAVNDMMFRVGLHHRQGKADVTDGGRVKVSGTGVGVGMARQYSDGLMVDGWLGVTKYDDIEVRSSEMVNGQLVDVNQKTEGVGYAIGLGASKRMGFGNLSLTQRGGLTWTSISVDDYVVSYTSMDGSAVRGMVAQSAKDAVSMESSSGVTGRYGVLFEGEMGKTSEACCKLFSSLDLEHDFSVERSVTITNGDFSSKVESESKPTRLRLGFGGSQIWNGDRSSVSGAIYLTSAGSGNNTVSGGVALSVKF